MLIFEDGSPLADKFTSFHRIPRDVPHVAGSEYVKVDCGPLCACVRRQRGDGRVCLVVLAVRELTIVYVYK